MIGSLPMKLTVGGEDWEIDSDYRNILCIFEAMEDDKLTDSDKLYILLSRLYNDFEKMPKTLYQEAYEKANAFLECHNRENEKRNPKLINWIKDEQMIFPAINAVAGMEVRTIPFMHWWTFLGYFENIDNECLWSFVLSIRQKKAKGKKLEKYEQEFYRQNVELCSVEFMKKKKSPEEELWDMFESLPEGG